MATKMNKLLICNNTDKSHKCNMQQKKIDTRVHTVGFHFYKVQEEQSLVIKVRIVFTFVEGRWTRKGSGEEGSIWSDGSVMYVTIHSFIHSFT